MIHGFGGRDGSQPHAGMVFDNKGNLYGTTAYGGRNGNGAVFELSPSGRGHWAETVIHSFLKQRDGLAPDSALIFDAAGSLYGTTIYGGNPICTQGCGTVFKLILTSGGTWKHLVLHRFNGVGGVQPVAPLVFDRAGNLYGGTSGGGGGRGCYGGGCGALFKLSPTSHGWRFSVLHVFNGTDGGGPQGAMIFDRAGNLYGTTIIGGNIAACPQQAGCGVVFKLSPVAHGKWTYRVLHKFNNGADGILPSGLVADKAGNLYGTTISGGAYSLGTVFEVTP